VRHCRNKQPANTARHQSQHHVDDGQEDMIEGLEIGGAATYIEVATKSHINLFI
jgi:predicted peroxiredoxin